MPITKVIKISERRSVSVYFEVPLNKARLVDGLQLLLNEMAMNLACFEEYFVDYCLNVGGGDAKLNVFAF